MFLVAFWALPTTMGDRGLMATVALDIAIQDTAITSTPARAGRSQFIQALTQVRMAHHLAI